MLMISSRKDFWSPTEFADADAVKDVDLVDPDPAKDIDTTTAELRAAVKGRRVLLLVHGYNNTEDDVSLAYARIEAAAARYLKQRYDMVMGYTWPGGAIGLTYPVARARANSAGPRLSGWLKILGADAASLDVMCHSLGARVMLKALGKVTGTPLRNLYLLAAAVDNESIEKGEEFFTPSRRSAGVVVMHSRRDKTLATWYRIGDAILPWQWLDLFDLALGYSGPEDPAAIINHSPHVKVVNCKSQELDHGDYKDHPVVFGFINQYLGGHRPDQFYTL